MQRKLQKFFSFFLLIFIFFSLYSSYAYSENYKNKFYKTFTAKNFSVDYQGLTPYESNIFPQNIILTRNSSIQTDSEMVLAFTQEHISKCEDIFLDFLDSISNIAIDYNIKILLSACDEESFSPQTDYLHPNGTETFTSSIIDSNIKCAVVIQENTNSIHEIISGGNGEVSPLWIIKSLKEACNKTGNKFHIPNSVSFLYRLRLIDTNKKVSSFLNQSIPCAGITIGYSTSDFEILKNFLQEQSVLNFQNTWDRHYSYIYIPFVDLEIWINETFFIFCFILFLISILFYICFSSFSKTQKNIAIFKDLFRIWYMIPIFIVITAFLLQQTQNFFLAITTNPISLICYKIITTFIIFNIIFIIQIKTSFKISYNVDKYIIAIVSAANIFLFCGIDISFLFLFFFEFCLCYVACKANSILSILISFLLMLIPFLPSSFNFITASNYQELLRFSSPTILGNLLIACLIFPFEIQWQRLLILTNRRIKFSLPVMVLLLGFICLSIYLFFYTIFIQSLNNKIEKNYNSPLIFNTDENSKDFIHPFISKDNFLDFHINHLTLKPLDNCTVLRYDISIEADKNIPLYNCNYEYIVTGKNKVYIKIPDYPQSNIELIYSSDKDIDQLITVTSYIETDDYEYIKESDTIFINK